jgi:hypothetical protein
MHQMSKYKKRSAQNMSADKLAAHIAAPYDALLISWLNSHSGLVLDMH